MVLIKLRNPLVILGERQVLDWVGVRSDCCTVGLFWGQIWTQSPALEAIASSKQSHRAIRHSITLVSRLPAFGRLPSNNELD